MLHRLKSLPRLNKTRRNPSYLGENTATHITKKQVSRQPEYENRWRSPRSRRAEHNRDQSGVQHQLVNLYQSEPRVENTWTKTRKTEKQEEGAVAEGSEIKSGDTRTNTRRKENQEEEAATVNEIARTNTRRAQDQEGGADAGIGIARVNTRGTENRKARADAVNENTMTNTQRAQHQEEGVDAEGPQAENGSTRSSTRKTKNQIEDRPKIAAHRHKLADLTETSAKTRGATVDSWVGEHKYRRQQGRPKNTHGASKNTQRSPRSREGRGADTLEAQQHVGRAAKVGKAQKATSSPRREREEKDCVAGVPKSCGEGAPYEPQRLRQGVKETQVGLEPGSVSTRR